MTDFFGILQPGLEYWRKQQDLEKVLVYEDQSGGKGPEPLDLDTGRVVMRMPTQGELASGWPNYQSAAGDDPDAPTDGD